MKIDSTRDLMDELHRLHRPTGASPLALIVEDDRSDVEIASRALRKAGCRVQVSHSGEGAVVALTESLKPEVESIDIVFLDLKLPGMSGVDVLRWIRREIPMMVVIVVTHAAYSLMIQEAAKEKFLELIEKPFTADCVTEILTKHKMQ